MMKLDRLKTNEIIAADTLVEMKYLSEKENLQITASEIIIYTLISKQVYFEIVTCIKIHVISAHVLFSIVFNTYKRSIRFLIKYGHNGLIFVFESSQ